MLKHGHLLGGLPNKIMIAVMVVGGAGEGTFSSIPMTSRGKMRQGHVETMTLHNQLAVGLGHALNLILLLDCIAACIESEAH